MSELAAETTPPEYADEPGSGHSVAGVPAQAGAPAAEAISQVSSPVLPDLGAGTSLDHAPGRDLRLLADVPVEIAVELGRIKLPLRDLLAMAPGAVFELDRPADAPVDVLVNGRLVARGEVVVIDGSFGVRVTSVVDASTRAEPGRESS